MALITEQPRSASVRALEDVETSVITGTFSTIYVAGAILVDWNDWVEARARRPRKAAAKA